MKVVITLAVCCLAVAFAAYKWDEHIVLNFVHNLKFIQLNMKSMNFTLLLAVSDVKQEKVCYVIQADAKLTKALNRHDSMVQATEEIYNLIHSGVAVKQDMFPTEVFSSILSKSYGSEYFDKTCLGHKNFLLPYSSMLHYGQPSTTTQVPGEDILD